MKKTLLALLASSLICINSAAHATPANVILIIGDGMDDQQITIARNYLKGAQGQLSLDHMPVRGAVQVLTVHNDDPTKPMYVADSANSATSIATGVITSRTRISTTAKTDQDIPTIIELAQAAGLKTGIVSTASVTDATPAAFVAHISKRFCENPSMMVDGLILGRVKVECAADTKANGGLGSISEQIADSQVDVVLGGGYKHFDQAAEGENKTVLQRAKDNNFHVITSAEQLTQTPVDKKLLGLFSPSTMPIKLQGENGRIAEKPQKSFVDSTYNITLPEPMRCEANPDFVGMPALAMMTDTAIKRLANEKGFFLIIESASIDKASHQRNPCGSIGELDQLNETLDIALAFAEKAGNTLVMVTADHGQAAQMIPEVSMFSTPSYGALPTATPGAVARIMTPEGSIMGVNYATNESFAEEHTGVNVAIFANQLGRELIKPLQTQPDIFSLSTSFLKLKSAGN